MTDTELRGLLLMLSMVRATPGSLTIPTSIDVKIMMSEPPPGGWPKDE